MEVPVHAKSRLARSARSFRTASAPTKAPACAGQLHPGADQVPARPFDDAGGDGTARREAAVVAQIRRILLQVVGAGIDRLATSMDVEYHGDVHAVGGGARVDEVELCLGSSDERDPSV